MWIVNPSAATRVRRLDSTVRFRIVFHGCLAEEVSSWLSGYPALNPALYPALYLQIEPRPSKCHHASWTNNLKRLGRFSAKNLKTSGQIFLALAPSILASAMIYSFVPCDLAVKPAIGGKFVRHNDGLFGDVDGNLALEGLAVYEIDREGMG